MARHGKRRLFVLLVLLAPLLATYRLLNGQETTREIFETEEEPQFKRWGTALHLGNQTATGRGESYSYSHFYNVPEMVLSENEPRDWRTPTLFHVSPNGRWLEGTFYRALKEMDKEYWDYGVEGCAKQHHLQVFWPKSNPKQCYWCPQNIASVHDKSCIQGRLELRRQMVDDRSHHSLHKIDMMRYISQRAYSTVSNRYSIKHQVMTLSCYFVDTDREIPHDIKGHVLVTTPKPMKFLVAPRSQLISAPSKAKDVVCVKNFYGKPIDSQSLTNFAKFYLKIWNFDSIILYELGLTEDKTLYDIIQSHEYLKEAYSQGRIIIVDLREELQRRYGILYQNVLLFSSSIGQLLTLNDCFIRGRFFQARWVLSIDTDEYITYGVQHSARPGDWSQYASLKAKEIAPEQLSVIRFPNQINVDEENDRSIRDLCGDDAWDEDKAAEFHRTNETIKMFRGYGKYAMRVDGEFLLTQIPSGVHTALPTCNFNKRLPGELLIKSSDMYIRHYRGSVNRIKSDASCSQIRFHVPWDWYDL